MLHEDTIAAIATPPGKGGLGVIRLSGERAIDILAHIIGRGDKDSIACSMLPRQFYRADFKDHNNEIIDQGLVVYFSHPKSFTGEDVVELHAHGGPLLLDYLLEQAMRFGARMARPGEFSERAFLNGKIDLTQAEAIVDLINAQSIKAIKAANRTLRGEFAEQVNALTQKTIKLRMYLEAGIDFSDEDIDFMSDAGFNKELLRLQEELEQLLKRTSHGILLNYGAKAVFWGEPNVGKSSLFNALLGAETAIVTPIPGTTRDLIKDRIIIDGINLEILDTAGIRESRDVIEQEGIKRALVALQAADLIIGVLDASLIDNNVLIKAMVQSITEHIGNINAKIVIVVNKVDLIDKKPMVVAVDNIKVAYLSAKTGAGIDLLKQEIKYLLQHDIALGENDLVARKRHYMALERGLAALKRAASLSMARCHELCAEELRLLQAALSEITGAFSADDLLGKIFSEFCIGK